MSKRIVVTGGAGFIGCNTVAELNARGIDDILVVDQLGNDEKWKNLRDLKFYDAVGIDAFRESVRKNEIKDVSGIIHLGACSATTEKDADYLLDNNYRYTRELCDWALSNDVRFVYASSAATYGDGSLGYSDADTLTPTYKPLNMYGYSKHLFDLWALRSGVLDKIVGLKYFNVYGPYEGHKGDMRSVVHKSFEQIQRDGKVALFKSYKPEYADGEQVRDFIYVKDAVDVTLFFLEHPEKNGLFNCGTGEPRTWLDLAKGVFMALEREPNIDFIEMPEVLQGKYQYHTEADIVKLRAIGYDKAFTSLEDGISSYVRDYLLLS